MNKDKKIKSQKAENKQKVVTALTDLDRVISKLQKHVSRYDKQIDAAGLRNDANEVKKLITLSKSVSAVTTFCLFSAFWFLIFLSLFIF